MSQKVFVFSQSFQPGVRELSSVSVQNKPIMTSLVMLGVVMTNDVMTIVMAPCDNIVNYCCRLVCLFIPATSSLV